MSHSFRFLWFGQSLLTLAGALYTITITILVYHATSSTTLAAMVTLVRVLTKMFSGIVVPVILDRFRLTFILSLSQLGQSLLLLGMASTIGFSDTTVYVVYLFFFVSLISFLDGWTVPARNSLLPRLVDESSLVRANSLLSTSDQTLALLGWTVGGVIVSQIGISYTLWLTLGLFVLSTLSMFCIRDSADQSTVQKKKSMKWDSMKEGWIALYQNVPLRIVTIMDILEGIAGGIWIGGITLVFVKNVLHQGEEWWGFINASYYVGTIVGGMLVWLFSSWVQKHLFVCIVMGSFTVSVLTLIYSLNTLPFVGLLLVLVLGPAYQLRDISQRTFFQKHVNSELFPKVLSSQSTLSYATFSFSVFLMGIISDWLGVQTVYLFSAVLYFISSFLGLLIKNKATQSPKVQMKG